MEEIVNRVALSPLVTLDLEEYYHTGERILYDIQAHLFQGLILKEKDFRAFIKSHDWTQYEGKNIAITCSADAIIPTWAYMLLAVQFRPYAHHVVFGSLADLENALFQKALAQIDLTTYQDKKYYKFKIQTLINQVDSCGKYAV